MAIKDMLKKAYNVAKSYSKKRNFFSRQENVFGLSQDEVKKANSLGFTADEYVIYDLRNNDPQDYISEYEREEFRNAVRDYRILLDNKIVFYSLIRNFARTNLIFAYKKNGYYVALEDGFSEDNVLNKLKECMRLVYKETNSGGGEGFRLLEYAGGRYCINRIACKEEDILSLLSKSNYLIEEYCCQGAFEQRLWPYSVNTIRIITLLFHGDIQVAAALQRIGIDKEKCVDNACAGGLYSSINLETGELSAARSHSPENLLEHDGTPKWFSNHPGTQAQIQGALIPEWTTLCNDIVNLHKKLAFTEIEFIAWDIALLDDGYKIIEANTSCSMDFLQTFKGARNEMIGKWMKEKGYIK